MLQKYQILNEIHKSYVVAVIRGKDREEAIEIAKQAYSGGIRVLEITFTTPGAEDVIAELSRLNKDNDMVIGAGTVLDEETARIAILKGARFIVSPHFDRSISLMCNRYCIPYLPGCGSVTDIMEAIKYGSDVIKMFPGSLLGTSFIKDVHGPLPHVEMMPSGGVSKDNLKEWVESGAFAIGIGSYLTKNIKNNDYSSVKFLAQEFMDLYKAIRNNEL